MASIIDKKHTFNFTREVKVIFTHSKKMGGLFSRAFLLFILSVAMAYGLTNSYGSSEKIIPSPLVAIKKANKPFTFTLWDGSQLVGKLYGETIRLHSVSHGSLNMPISGIDSIVSTNSNTPAVLTTTNGATADVRFVSPKILVNTIFGNVFLPVKVIYSIDSATPLTPASLTLKNQLLSFWNFNGTNANSYTPDGGSLSYALQTGNDGRGPVNVGSSTVGIVSNAVGFGNFGNQGLYIPSGSFPILTTFTITAWVKLHYNTNIQTQRSLIACSWDGLDGWNFILNVNNGKLEGAVGIQGTYAPGDLVTDKKANFYDENWHLCVFQCSDAKYIRVKVDNGSWTTLPISGSLAGATARPFQVGQNIAQSVFNSDCDIDMLGVWDRVLTDPEISQLYNNGAGLEFPF